MTILTGSIQLARDTEANWTAANPVLLAGAIYVSTNVFYGATNSPKFKIGNGVSNWVATDYHPDSGGASGITIDTTAITSGTAGRLLLESATNKVSESVNLAVNFGAGIFNIGYSVDVAVDKYVNIGGTTQYALLQAFSEGVYDQFRAGYDVDNFFGFNVDSNGNTLFFLGATAGIPIFTFDSPFTGRFRPRTLVTNAPGATPSTDTDNYDFRHFTGLNTAITSMTTNLSGTPTEYQAMQWSFTDDGTARAITWGADFENGPADLPTTTRANIRLDVGFRRNTITNKWRCMAAGPL